ncbi:MAG: carbohydrate ABC transporter permease [Candidatus Omnitrophica bacterium]|nr:carbohydrate ABC transporter permease [Candidatus Omnitrophota bacterium]
METVSKRIIIYAFLTIGALAMAIPYVWMVVTSIKPIEEVQAYPPSFIVHHPTLAPYRELFSILPMARYLFNSLIVAGLVTITNVFFCSLAGYAFAKHKFFGRDKLFILLLSAIMIPYQVNLIPGFIIVKNFGWLNSFQALIIPNIAMAFGVFLCRQFISSIPNELLDAAKIDGCSEFGIYRLVIFPLIKPALATLAIFTFFSQWNSFVWPLVVIHTSSMRTIPLALSVLNSQFGANFSMIMAGATVITLPVLAVFLSLQKYIIPGITMTRLKG